MGAKKILVVDDSLTIQKVIRLALANEGYEIQAVSSGNDVLSTLSHFRPQVVLIDFSIPGKSAFEIRTESLRISDLANIKFVVMSSAFENVDEAKLAEHRFDGRLVKPFDPSHLRQALEEVFKKSAGGIPVSGAPPLEDSGFIKRPVTPSIPQPPNSEMSWGVGGSVEHQEPTLSFEPPRLGGGLNPEPTVPAKPKSPPPFTPPPAAKAPQAPSAPKAPTPRSDAPLESFGIKGSEDDIKNLTETTIKMSGLDNFEWSVNDDSIKSNSPSAPPPKQNTFSSDQFDVDQMQASEPDLAPPVNYLDRTEASLQINAGNSYPSTPESIQIDAVEFPETYVSQPQSLSFDPPPSYNTPGGGAGFQNFERNESSVVPLSTEQMEKLLGSQLEQTLERVARKILPDIAEKVIREEIRKILSEPPL